MTSLLEKIGIHSNKKDEHQIFTKFFLFHKCYDLIPTSSKLVVLDVELNVKTAFHSLVYNEVRAAPLWDSDKQRFVGMLTVTDFIRVLHSRYHRKEEEAVELEEQKLRSWRNEQSDTKGIIWINPDASLLEAIRALTLNRIHRLPVIHPNTGNVLFVLTYKRIIKFLFLYIHDLPRPGYFSESIGDLPVGTYKNIETARAETPVIDALGKFIESRVSALPIVDNKGRLVDIYAKFDVINLATQNMYTELDISLKEANEEHSDKFEGVLTCKKTDSLYSVMKKIVKADVHRLIVTDCDRKVLGVVSLSDILSFLILHPEQKETVTGLGDSTQKKIGVALHGRNGFARKQTLHAKL